MLEKIALLALYQLVPAHLISRVAQFVDAHGANLKTEIRSLVFDKSFRDVSGQLKQWVCRKSRILVASK